MTPRKRKKNLKSLSPFQNDFVKVMMAVSIMRAMDMVLEKKIPITKPDKKKKIQGKKKRV